MSIQEIVLVSPPTNTNRTPEECLGLEYLTAESRGKGHLVHYIDAWINKLSVVECTDRVLFYKPGVVGISPSMDSLSICFELIKQLREKDYRGRIVMGGIYASFEAETILAQTDGLLDGIFLGEADISFQQFLESGSIEETPGTISIRNGQIQKGRKIDLAKLDDLPLPSRETLGEVRKIRTPSHVMGSKGCYGNCSFCSVSCFQKFSSEKSWRGRTPESIVSELIALSSQGETMVKFIDDNFFGPGDKKRESRFVKLLEEAKLPIRFRLSLRVNDVEDDLIKRMKRVGLFAVSLGVESFVQRKLNDFQKGTTVFQNFEALRILEKYGVFVQMGHIMFDPFVTLEEAEKEVDGLEKTLWAVTKGIDSQLFAAEGTQITDRLRRQIGFIGKEGTNNTYQFVDLRVRRFYEALKMWTRANSGLYEKTIDPISAPKNIPHESFQRFHKLYIELKKIDLLVIRRLLEGSHQSDSALKMVVSNSLLEYQPVLDEIKAETERLYVELGLNYSVSENKRI